MLLQAHSNSFPHACSSSIAMTQRGNTNNSFNRPLICATRRAGHDTIASDAGEVLMILCVVFGWFSSDKNRETPYHNCRNELEDRAECLNVCRNLNTAVPNVSLSEKRKGREAPNANS